MQCSVGLLQVDDLLSESDSHSSSTALVPVRMGVPSYGDRQSGGGREREEVGQEELLPRVGTFAVQANLVFTPTVYSPSSPFLRGLSILPGPLLLHLIDTALVQYVLVLEPWVQPGVGVAMGLRAALEACVASPRSHAGQSLPNPFHHHHPLFSCSSLYVAPVEVQATVRMGWYEQQEVQGEGGAEAGNGAAMDPARALLLPLFASLGTTRLTLSAVSLDRPLATSHRIAQEWLASVLTDVILSSPALIGSLDILGNPSHLVRSIASGIVSLVAEPARALTGVREGTPGEGQARARAGAGVQQRDVPVLGLLSGIARGARGFVSHVGEGVLTSVSGVSLSLARSVRRVTATRLVMGGARAGAGAGREVLGAKGEQGPQEQLWEAAWAQDEAAPAAIILLDGSSSSAAAHLPMHRTRTSAGEQQQEEQEEEGEGGEQGPALRGPFTALFEAVILNQGSSAGAALAVALDSVGQTAAGLAATLSVQDRPHHITRTQRRTA